MNEKWSKLEERFQEMSDREKWLIALCGFVCIGMILFSFVLEPKLTAIMNNKQKLSQLKSENQQLQGQNLVLQAKLKKDPNADVNAAISRLMVQSQKLSTQLGEIVEHLVTPSEMSRLLETVLSNQKGVHLVSMVTLPAEPIVKNNNDEKQQKQYSGYYIHPLKMVLEGDYFSIAQYLNSLEQLPESYFWRNLSYQVTTYPKAQLEIEVYTLGTREEFIGG